MLNIIQSNKMEVLFYHLLLLYQQPKDTKSIFESFDVIVPSMVMGEWIKKQVADKAGISALITTEFWGRYQLNLMQKVLKTYARHAQDEKIKTVPEVAMLSKKVMQWQIFGYCLANKQEILENTQHELYNFLININKNLDDNHQPNFSQSHQEKIDWVNNQSLLDNQQVIHHTNIQSFEQRLWQFANDMASMLNRYMTYRPTWLNDWEKNQPLPIEKMITDKDNLQNRLQGRVGDDQIFTPDWLVEHYIELEKAQRFLWKTLFIGDYQYREEMHQQFWQAFTHQNPIIQQKCRQLLPKNLILFTVQQLPPNELIDLQRLGELTNVTLLHFNPSQQFWADIVDKNWLLQQQIDNPQAIYLKDYGHTLLSRFGKQSREVFAMLANLSGNEFQRIDWQDDFINNEQPVSLLEHLQQDILMLEENQTQQKIQEMLAFDNSNGIKQQQLEQIRQLQKGGLNNQQVLTKILQKLEHEFTKKQQTWQLPTLDTSLSIHACYSTVRQLEVLRSMIIAWLNYTDIDEEKRQNYQQLNEHKRKLSDILVLLPDIDAQQSSIEAIFPKGVGIDGYDLPAKVTGVVAKEVNQLWQAVIGYYQLLNRVGARFTRSEVFDWLMLPPIYESFGLNLDDMKRACDLLEQAGFIRGFDEAHLQQTLHQQDDDYRFSFAFALERLVAGLLMPNADAVNFGTFINHFGEQEKIKPLKLLNMGDAGLVSVLCQIFQTLHQHRNLGQELFSVTVWLEKIEQLIQERFAIFIQSNALRAIFSAQNMLKRTVQASEMDNLSFKLNFILESIAEQLMSQQVSAEPTGMITFARIGAVRNIPFKLVVLLNMNFSDFPQREPPNRYNLMQASVAKRGDKFREDDDLGAFLDAILCANEACWLFYNGKSISDTNEHLPASPVQELLSFLQTEIGLQQSIKSENSLSESMTFGQQLEQYLVSHHPALPFDKQYFQDFTKNTDQFNQVQHQKSQIYPPAKIWYNIYHQLVNQNEFAEILTKIDIWQQSTLQEWLNCWKNLKNELTPKSQRNGDPYLSSQYLYLSNVVRSLQNTAKSFIRYQQLFIQTDNQESQELEPLNLDNLQYYQLGANLLQYYLTGDSDRRNKQISENNTLPYHDWLPVGVGRYVTFRDTNQQILNNLTDFIQKIQQIDIENRIDLQIAQQVIQQHITTQKDIVGILTICQEQRISVEVAKLDKDGKILTNHEKQRLVLAVNLPQILSDNHQQLETNCWIAYLPNSGREKYWVQFWLSHLCWQILRETTDEQVINNDGFSLWQFSHQQTLYLPAISWQQAYCYLQDWLMIWQLSERQLLVLPPSRAIDYIESCEKSSDDKPVLTWLTNWSKSPYQVEAYDDNFHHQIWQILLNGYKADVIKPFLQVFAHYLYQPLITQLTKIKTLNLE